MAPARTAEGCARNRMSELFTFGFVAGGGGNSPALPGELAWPIRPAWRSKDQSVKPLREAINPRGLVGVTEGRLCVAA